MDFDAEIAAFLNQPSVRRALHQFAVQQLRSGGSGGSGGKAAVEADAIKYAEEARREIIDSLPASLKSGSTRPITENDLLLSPVEVTQNGDFEITMQWSDRAVRRDSLYLEGYPNGIDDIVALFSHGYSARKYAYGYWVGHNNPWGIRSRKVRQADPFLVQAIDKFNQKHAADHVKLILLDTKNYLP